MATTTPTTLINGRPAVDIDGAVQVTGKAWETIYYWERNRARLGFPERADERHWYIDDLQAFVAKLDAGRLAGLTAIDYSGNPDDVLNAEGAAKTLGYRSRTSLLNSKVGAALDAVADVETLNSGRLRRTWTRAQVWEVGERRTGVGSGPTGRPAKLASERTVDRSGNPDEIVGSAEAARILDYPSPNKLPDAVLALAVNPSETGKRTIRKYRRSDLIGYHDQQLAHENAAE